MNIEELNTQLEYLKETKNLIKEQLIAKGQPVDDNTPFREYVDNMNDLVDTTDANAVTSDIATGKSGYVDGQKVDGNLRDIASGSASSFIGTNFTVEDKPQFNLLDFTLPFTVDLIHRQGSIERLNVTYDKIATPINLSSGQIKAGETILGIAGSVVELNGDTETVTPTTSQQIITPTSPKNGFTQVTVNAVTSAIDNNIKTENIKSGVTILGVSGKSSVVDTSDANATDNDLVENTSAYVNGVKINGTIYDQRNESGFYSFSNIAVSDNPDTENIEIEAEIELSSVGYSSVVFDANTKMGCDVPYSDIASTIELNSDIIVQGNTILGVEGTFNGVDTSDATATENDIVAGTTAYVDGVEILGNIEDQRAGEIEATVDSSSVSGGTDLSIITRLVCECASDSVAINGDTDVVINNIDLTDSTITNGIGLTANKIKVGETILGITGTYAGSAMKEYASITDMNNDIANIEAEEVVKVANISMPLPDYYIKSYNSSTSVYEMVKLVKESETISPQDFEEAEDQIGDLFGEGENN